MTAADTPSWEELLNGLIQDALDILHHDRTEGSDVDLYERKSLRQKFSARLAARPADDGVREATIEECAGVAEQAKPSFCADSRDELSWYVAERIANNIRALSTKAP